jgi:epsilon-lactone hydrolase
MPSDELAAFIDMFRAIQSAFLAGSIEEQRAGWDLFGAATAALPEPMLEDVEAGGVPAQWVTAPGVSAGRVVLFLHGGGYVIGSLESHRAVAARLSAAADARVLLLDYRRAPEHPFPAAVEDAGAAASWLISQGVEAGSLAFAGDSAGGGLAIAACVSRRDGGEPLPGALVCFSPWADLTMSGESVTTRADADVVLTAEWLAAMAGHYLQGSDPRHPLASPLFAALAGLPPMLVMVGTDEMFYDDAIRLVAAASEAGVEVTLEVFEEAVHEWMVLAPASPEAADALAKAGAFLRSRWA